MAPSRASSGVLRCTADREPYSPCALLALSGTSIFLWAIRQMLLRRRARRERRGVQIGSRDFAPCSLGRDSLFCAFRLRDSSQCQASFQYSRGFGQLWLVVSNSVDKPSRLIARDPIGMYQVRYLNLMVSQAAWPRFVLLGHCFSSSG